MLMWFNGTLLAESECLSLIGLGWMLCSLDTRSESCKLL